MQVNFNPQVKHQQNFGMAIRSSEGGIRRLTEYISKNQNEIFKLNELVASEARHTNDIFLSTDKFNKLTARVGFLDFSENPNINVSPIDLIENAVNFRKSLERNNVLKSKINLSAQIDKDGYAEALKQIMNKMKIDKL